MALILKTDSETSISRREILQIAGHALGKTNALASEQG